MQWEAREYAAGDEEGILALFRDAFGTKRSLAHWNWEFRNGPAGTGVIHLARADGRIVGQYAIVPVRMTFAGKSILGAQSVDTMTESAYRRQGVFEDLARRTFRKAGDLGVDLVYGFPNRYSYPGLVKKLGFVSVSPVREYRYRLDWRRIVADRRPKSILNSLVGEYVNLLDLSSESSVERGAAVQFGDAQDKLWEKVARDAGIAVAKTSDYVRWRYRSCPDARYEVVQITESGAVQGLAIWAKDGTLATLVDLVAPSDRVAGQLRVAVAKDARASGCRAMREWIVLAGGRHDSRSPRASAYQEPTVLVAFSPTGTFSREELSSPARWTIRMGDSDGV